jgi:hypothetical protein
VVKTFVFGSYSYLEIGFFLMRPATLVWKAEGLSSNDLWLILNFRFRGPRGVRSFSSCAGSMPYGGGEGSFGVLEWRLLDLDGTILGML